MQRLIASLISAALLSGCATSVSFQSAVRSPNESKMPVPVHAALSMPKGSGPFPAVVLLHAAGGVRSHVSADWPAVLNAHGYAALTVDSCDSSNVQTCIATRGQWMSRMWGDALGALDFLAAVPQIDPDAVGVMGFSAGAFTVEGLIGSSPVSPKGHKFSAGIVVYGNCVVPGTPSMPGLEIIGDQDRNSSNCGKSVEMDAAKNVVFLVIPGATHAFDQSEITTMTTVAGGYPAIYNHAATQEAHREVIYFLDGHLRR
jgi:dienelactone hydrolase